MASEQLHSSNAVAAAMVFASIMAPAAIGASLAGKMHALTAQRAGMLGFALFVLFLLVTLRMHALSDFFLASVLAVIYATSYTGVAVPTLIVRISTPFRHDMRYL